MECQPRNLGSWRCKSLSPMKLCCKEVIAKSGFHQYTKHKEEHFFGIINIHNGVIEGKNLFELLSTWVHRKTWDGNMLGLFKQEENGPRHVFRVEDVSGHSRHGSLTFLHSSKVLAWDAKGKQSWNSICLKSKSDQDREDNLPAKLLVIKLVSTKLGCTVLTRTPLPATY